jgi:hypothetical protein
MNLKLTFTERERFAFMSNDRSALALIHAGEEEFETVVSPEHEAVINDRNRLADALQRCIDRMNDAVFQLDQWNTRNEPPADDDQFEHAPAFLNAIEGAEAALTQIEPQDAETTAGKLLALQSRFDALQARFDALQADRHKAEEVFGALRYLTAPYRGYAAKPAPKWAAYALSVLARIGKT